MVNICAPGGVPTTPKEVMDLLHGIQDMGYEAMSMYIQAHNNFMKLAFLFGETQEFELGNKLPAMILPVSLAQALKPFQDQLLRNLP